MISETIRLDRLTGNLSKGFYIDVGANHPIEDSVTRVFYERGWNGINIEPLPEQIELLNVHRLRDINLQVACGAKKGEIELFYQGYSTNGLTTSNKELAMMGQKAGVDWKVPSFVEITTFKVSVLPLSEICDKYVIDKVIDFLKIDVEGMEKEVILGMDWKRYRPRALCIESVQPHSCKPVHNEWESLLFEANYTFVENDTYNRYYKSNN